ncbi:hypothetical protein [Undibacterium sp. TC9W]|uniref:hypothetical protein n=1 Tax=Undibacterium sp. TC9W TaxID=3413053 RepID=UPI003BF3EFD8
MDWIEIIFKIVCPEEIDGQPNTDGLALAEELNDKCGWRLERDQEAVWRELYQVDDELVEKYQLTVNAFTNNQKLSEFLQDQDA